jgi:hypothetical protein
VTYQHASEASAVYERLSQLMRVHTTTCRLAENHPANFGLVAHKIEVAERWGSPQSLLDRAGVGRGYGNEDLCNQYLALLPADFVNPEAGWFQPGQDATVFGAYHLVVNGDLEARSSWRSSDDLGWVLRQAAIEGALDTMGWDNVARMKDAVSRVVGEDLDTAMTIRALTDTERVAKAAKEHAYKLASRAARITFANTQLRPRLVPELVEKTARDAGHELNTGWRYDEDFDISGLLSLDGWSITRGLEKESLEHDGRGNIKAVNACYRLVLKESAGPKKFADLVTAVQTALSARKLGTVAYDAARTDRMWVSLKPELLLKHRAAFGIADNITLVTVNGPVPEPVEPVEPVEPGARPAEPAA